MAKDKNSLSYVLTISFIVALVSGLAVAAATIVLRPIQAVNEKLAFQQSILEALHVYKDGIDIGATFDKLVEPKVIDLNTGDFVSDIPLEKIQLAKMLADKAMYSPLTKEQDVAKINRRQNYDIVYMTKKTDGSLDAIVLPVRGYGLWSTMYGFIALDSDLNTIRGITFYAHAETPGLGGEIDNPKWKEKWIGKKVFNGDKLDLRVVKNNATNTPYTVDAISGATLTSNGVGNLVKFWFGADGFEKFLKKLHNASTANISVPTSSQASPS